ncbi:MAG: tol-pal system-associated acyl-CoA thioesterase [Gammaproteobacteria bacterium]
MSDLAQFAWPVRVYYEDTDSGGVVYYANYLKFMERARTELLRQCGIEQERLKREGKCVFTVHSLDIQYLQPAHLDDFLNVSATIEKPGKTSLHFSQQVSCQETGRVFCQGRVRIACLHAETFRPERLPETLLSEITHVC